MKMFKTYLESLIGYDKDVVKEVRVAGAVILKPNEEETNSVLLIKRSSNDKYPNAWEFPRGRENPGEKDILKTLKREVKEETGLDVIPIKYINKFEYIADEGTRKSTQYNYLCRLKDQSQEIILSKEHDDYKWVHTFAEVELLTSWGEIKKTISYVLNPKEKIVVYPKTKEVIEETTKSWVKK